MKKRILISAIMMMVMCMSACIPQSLLDALVSEDVTSEQVSNSDEGLEVESESESETDNEQDNDATEGEQSDSTDYLDVEVIRTWDSYYDETQLMYGHYDKFALSAPEYPELEKAVEQFNESHVADNQSYFEELREWSISDYQDNPDNFYGPYIYEEDMCITRADAKALSVVSRCYSYSGGAHGMVYFERINLDAITGEELALEDVIVNTEELPKVLSVKVTEKYPELENLWETSWEETFEEYLAPAAADGSKPEFTWTLGYEGVTFYFSSYELGAYVYGVQTITLTYAEYPELLNGAYFENLDQNYVVKLMINSAGGADGESDLNDDGVLDAISVTRNYDYDLCVDYGVDYSESYNVTVNGNTYVHENYCYNLTTYLVKSGSNNYLYVQRQIENDYKSVSVFKITENSVEYMGEFDGSVQNFTNSLDFDVMARMDLLSTYNAIIDCYVGEDGMPVEKGNAYEVTTEVSIISTVEITAELVDEEDYLTGESYTFPARTEFIILKTDGMTYVDVQADDGQMCRFYTTPEWPPTVNGMDAESSFEMLWYAG